MGEIPHRTRRVENKQTALQLLASTSENITSKSSKADSAKELEAANDITQNDTAILRNAQWSPDGTTVLVSSEDRRLRSYILPHNLLDFQGPQVLSPYCIHETPSPVYATVIHPSFSLSSPSTALFLASCSSLPVRLLSPFSPSIIASYPLVHAATEAYLAPHSLIFSRANPNKFLAGTDSLIAEFDLSRPSSRPTMELPTIPSKRKTLVGGGVGMKGLVSTMALSSSGVLCAGTFTGWLGLYDSEGIGDTLAVFPVTSKAENDEQIRNGAGVTSVLWTKCGRYLTVAERGSDGIGVWDIRGSGRRLAWLSGRRAVTMQRMSITLAAAPTNLQELHDEPPPGLTARIESLEEIRAEQGNLGLGEAAWAGGTDGMVRMWANVGKVEGTINPSWSFAAHAEAVGAVELHPYAGVIATCSGARSWGDELHDSRWGLRDDDSSDEDSTKSGASIGLENTRLPSIRDRSLKLWAL